MTSILKVTEIQDPTNSNKAIEIDSSGRVTQPANPAFTVIATGSGWTSITSGSNYAVPFNSENYDRGNNFDTGTYRWTAPIDCLMMFGVQMYMDAASSSYTRFRLFEDSTQVHERIHAAPETSVPEGASQSTVLYDVTAGSEYYWTVQKDGTSPQIYLHSGTTLLKWTYCWGYMVG